MSVKNLNIIKKLQDACRKKDVYEFLNTALFYYNENGLDIPENVSSLALDDLSEDEKIKIMYAETIRIQNESVIK